MLLGASRCRPGGLLLALFSALPAAAMAETYEAIDCPDSFYTEARGINDRGDIVGICDYVTAARLAAASRCLQADRRP